MRLVTEQRFAHWPSSGSPHEAQWAKCCSVTNLIYSLPGEEHSINQLSVCSRTRSPGSMAWLRLCLTRLWKKHRVTIDLVDFKHHPEIFMKCNSCNAYMYVHVLGKVPWLTAQACFDLTCSVERPTCFKICVFGSTVTRFVRVYQVHLDLVHRKF